MSLPFSLPGWLPWWAMIVVMVPVLIYALALLFMPFNTIGVKGRLDQVEARLDEIQGEIRALALRLAERGAMDRGGEMLAPTYREAARGMPPIPPAGDYENEGDEAAYRYRDAAPPARPPAYPPAAYPPADMPAPRPDMPRRPPARRPEQRPEPGRPEPRIEWPR